MLPREYGYAVYVPIVRYWPCGIRLWSPRKLVRFEVSKEPVKGRGVKWRENGEREPGDSAH
jgi:hypothetical protein